MGYPVGISVRPVDLAGDGPAADGPDVDLAWRVAAAAEAGIDVLAVLDREEIRTMLASPEADRRGHRLACRGREPVGLLIVEIVPAGRNAFLDAYAVPPPPVREGSAPEGAEQATEHAAEQAREQAAEPAGTPGPDPLLVALLQDGLATARRHAAADPGPGLPPGADPYQPHPDDWQAEAGAFASDARYRAALAACGFRPVRRHWRLAVDLAGADGDDPPAPPGVRRVVARDEAQWPALHAVFRESFAAHYGTVDRPYPEWIAAIRALPGCDPDRWWLALLDDVPVGLCLSDDSRAEAGIGYVRTLGVVPSARGRGIGRWLLRCALADAVRRGRTSAALSVDSENASGALALYESVGMRPVEVIDQWRRPVGP